MTAEFANSIRCYSDPLYAAQFLTRRFGRGIWCQRAALALCSMKGIPGASKQAIPYAIPDIPATRCIPVVPRHRYVSAGRTAMVANNRQSSYPLSLLIDTAPRIIENGVEVSHETVRKWGLKFGREIANGIRRRRPQGGDK
jgi:hypothetical protein